MLKKCSISEVIDSIFWGLVLLFPFIAYVIYLMCDKSGAIPLGMVEFFTTVVPLNMSGTIFEIFHDLFVTYMPFFTEMSWVSLVFTWFVFVEFAHCVFDILVFIPRLCHYWISCFGGKLK